MNDKQIINEIVKEKGWNAGSVWSVIDKLRKNEEIGENANKKETRLKGFFSKMSDQELVEFAKKFIEERGIDERRELKKADLGLYMTLRNRREWTAPLLSYNQIREKGL